MQDRSYWYWLGFFTSLIVILMGLILSTGCTGDYRVDEILLSSVDKHEFCKEKHYIDPYTKIEYCLPIGFTNMRNLHIYKVEDEND